MTTAHHDPFTVLGLPASRELTDAQVHEAWLAIATATHPDSPGGGDPARFEAASAAYAELRTPWSRREAYADLTNAKPLRRKGLRIYRANAGFFAGMATFVAGFFLLQAALASRGRTLLLIIGAVFVVVDALMWLDRRRVKRRRT